MQSNEGKQLLLAEQDMPSGSSQMIDTNNQRRMQEGPSYYEEYVTDQYPVANQPEIQQGGYVGRLQVQTFAGRGAFPVAGAQVTIYQGKDDLGRQVNYFLTTNAQGETPTVTLPAPPPSNSQSPNLPAYSLYYVQIDHPAYYTMKDLPVQVFPQQTAVLPVMLVPRRSDV